MDFHTLVLADQARVRQFGHLPTLLRKQTRIETWFSGDNFAWTGERFDGHALAVTDLGPAAALDPNWPEYDLSRLAAHQEQVRRSTAAVWRERLRERRVPQEVRPDRHGERLAWLLHCALLQTRCSCFDLPDALAGMILFGADRRAWPRTWRQQIAESLRRLCWWHLTACQPDAAPEFSLNTALLLGARDLRGECDQQCHDTLCADLSGPHQHFRIKLGAGFAGILDELAQADPQSGIRSYNFPGAAHSAELDTWGTLGRSGRLVSLYLPARLGDPAACAELTPRQHRLLQAVVREQTRQTGRNRNQSAVLKTNQIPRFSGRGKTACHLLPAAGGVVGFNGNGKRKGLGYRVAGTSGSWLARSGYEDSELSAFLGDLRHLADRLELIPVALDKERFYSPSELIPLPSTPRGRERVEQMHLRVYAPADWQDRWNRFFRWPPFSAQTQEDEELGELVSQIEEHQVVRKDLAAALGLDPANLSKILRGKRQMPRDFPGRTLRWIHRDQTRPFEDSGLLAAEQALHSGEGGMLEVALAYARCGWSVLPQKAGEKHPAVRWKEFQTSPAGESKLREWFQQWPDAGVAVILGRASGLFVVDVDGEEAHAELLRRLGEEPITPKSWSGSAKPYRYHIFFQHPGCTTRAKYTPWHPKLEFRGENGLVILPPALHASGNRYRWAEGQSPAETPLLPVPRKILRALQDAEQTAVGALPDPVSVPDDLLSAVAPSTREFLRGQHANGPNWNGKIFQAGCDLKGRDVPHAVAEELILRGAAPRTDADRRQALDTIRSAYSQPRDPGVI